MNLSFLTNKEVDNFKKNNILTDDEEQILYHLRKQDMDDTSIMLELCLIRNTYYDIKKQLISKLIRTGLDT